MDELEKRRQKLAEPSAEARSMQGSNFENLSDKEIEQMKIDYQFEKQLEEAMNVSVPENLDDKILLNQRTGQRVGTRFSFFSFKPALSLAASITLIAFLIFNTQDRKLSEIALAHVYHELDHLVEGVTPIDHEKVLKTIHQLGFELPNLPKNISYAGQCVLGDKKGMHIVVRINNNPVTLFISQMPVEFENEFNDNRFNGKIYPTKNGSIIVIGESTQDIDMLYSQTRSI